MNRKLNLGVLGEFPGPPPLLAPVLAWEVQAASTAAAAVSPAPCKTPRRANWLATDGEFRSRATISTSPFTGRSRNTSGPFRLIFLCSSLTWKVRVPTQHLVTWQSKPTFIQHTRTQTLTCQGRELTHQRCPRSRDRCLM